MTGKPGTKWWSRSEKPGNLVVAFGMMPAPRGNSPIFSRNGVVSPPKRPRISRLGLRMQHEFDAERRRGALPRVVVRRRADAAEREHDIRARERPPQRRGDPLRAVAEVLGPLEPQAARAEDVDELREMLVLALAAQDLVADDDCAERHVRTMARDRRADDGHRFIVCHIFCSRLTDTGTGVLSSCAKSCTRSSSSSQRNCSSCGSTLPPFRCRASSRSQQRLERRELGALRARRAPDRRAACPAAALAAFR